MMRIKVLGAFLIASSILGIIFFMLALPVDLYYYEMSPYFAEGPGFVVSSLPWDIFDWRWAITIPVYSFFTLACIFLMWMGFKLVTTPLPNPARLEERDEAPPVG
jgi:hypothetical protein